MDKQGLFYHILFFTGYILFCFTSVEDGLTALELIWLVLRIITAFWVLKKIFVSIDFSFSLEKIFYIFIFMFFLVAPVSQYFNSVILWGAAINHHSVATYMYADVLIYILLCCYNLGVRKGKLGRRLVVSKDISYAYSPFLLMFFTGLHLVIFSWFFVNIGFPEMLFRETNTIVKDAESAAFGLIMSKYLKSLSIAIVFMIVGNLKHGFVFRKVLILLNLVIFTILFFPTSAARFQILAVYLGLFLFIKRDKVSRHLISNIFIVGLFVIFPFLDLTRHITDFSEISRESISKAISVGYSDGNYDSYQMFVNCTWYVSNYGVTLGSQLLVVLLFFVPRSIWPSKPVGSGFEVADGNSLSFQNVSMPIVGEGYINYGIFGVVLLGFLFGYVSRKFDRKFWTNPLANNKFSHFYLVFIGYFFFMNRGDLLSSFAFTVALFLAFYTIHLMTMLFIKK